MDVGVAEGVGDEDGDALGEAPGVPLAPGVGDPARAVPVALAAGVPVDFGAEDAGATPESEDGVWSRSAEDGGSTSSHTATMEPTSSAISEPRKTR